MFAIGRAARPSASRWPCSPPPWSLKRSCDAWRRAGRSARAADTLSNDIFWSQHYQAGVAAGTVFELDYPVSPKPGTSPPPPTCAGWSRSWSAWPPDFRALLENMALRHGERLRAIMWKQRPTPKPRIGATIGYQAWTGRRSTLSWPTAIRRLTWRSARATPPKFARRAIADNGLRTAIVSVDPAPRAEVDAICDEMHRVGFEDFDLARLDALEPQDVMFIDNSHRAFSNSDVTVFSMETVGRLPRAASMACTISSCRRTIRPNGPKPVLQRAIHAGGLPVRRGGRRRVHPARGLSIQA